MEKNYNKVTKKEHKEEKLTENLCYQFLFVWPDPQHFQWA
jgi:hypothetical protein